MLSGSGLLQQIKIYVSMYVCRKTAFDHYQKKKMEFPWACAEKIRRDREEYLGG